MEKAREVVMTDALSCSLEKLLPLNRRARAGRHSAACSFKIRALRVRSDHSTKKVAPNSNLVPMCGHLLPPYAHPWLGLSFRRSSFKALWMGGLGGLGEALQRIQLLLIPSSILLPSNKRRRQSCGLGWGQQEERPFCRYTVLPMPS